ncbi:MAG TPA: Spy/CpxP family protein refolding chaperone [Pyrinomonadaceae bacterium]|nr:Spy/CpxP family protein refolding chaperone [Pyrinomonadaceae bacterium]
MQLNRTRKIVGGLALAGTMALSGIVGFAQQGTTQGTPGGDKDRGAWGRGERGDHKKGGRGMHGGGGGFAGRFAGELNLTDAQKAQMGQITARYRETAKAGRRQQRQGRGERRGGFDAFNGGTFNEAEVRAAAQARANAQVEREVARARMMSELYAVLTAEQKAQLTAQRQQREQRRQERRMRRNADGAVAPASRT